MVVAEFIDDKVVIAKLNEPYYRTEIPEGTYDALFRSVTAIEHIEAVETAWVLFSNEIADRSSMLFKVSESDPAYKAAVRQIVTLHKSGAERTKLILEKRSLFLPSVRNRLRQTVIAALARKAKNTAIAARRCSWESTVASAWQHS